MSGDASPRFVRRRLAAPESLAGDFVADRKDARALLATAGPTGPGGPRAGRLGAAAFTTTSAGTADALPEIVADGRGVLVTTGQQPGLFAGPLYVLYKALTAVAEARRWSAETGGPALACFWVAGDDHDWEEVAAARLVDREGQVRTFTLEPPPERAGRPVGPSPLPPEVDEAAASFAAAAGASEFSEAVFAPLRAAYRAGTSFTGAFERVLAELLAGVDIAILDGGSSEVHGAAAPLLRRALERAADCDAAFRAGTEAVRRAGYEPRLRPPDGGTHVFWDGPAGRVHLVRTPDGISAGPDGDPLPVAAWVERLEQDPGRFSAGAALRPVLESWLLPVGATVLGPGEIAYWAQLPQLFAVLEVPLPAIVPRASWTVVERKVDRWLDRVEASPEELAAGTDGIEARIVASHRPERLEAAIREARSCVGRSFTEVEAAAQDELPGIRSAIGKARKHGFDAIGELEATMDARVREIMDVRIDQARRAAAHLYPGGRPQERIASPFGYLALYGPAFLAALRRAHGLE
ncbi:MAG: bacillithiol biosynthesis cysteine-adding enzyme BshC [Gemmatimonadota bacterium]|nr:bacillithiol biosynthesis cysteine-adding enzyme BshC [Gemmatimonadota bacterium]